MRLRSLWRPLLSILYLVFLAGGMLSRPVAAQSQTHVDVLTFDGPVTPILVNYVQRGITEASRDGAEALIVQLDTPGGSTDLMQTIIQDMLSSPVPVVVYVYPTGAHAGSAGTFITLAAHVAAMTPGSSIGAASPVGEGGADLPETIKSKLVNILTADIENLSKRRGEKAVEFARQAVEEARAATADEAKSLGIIDFVAPSLPNLLEQMDGFTVTIDGSERVLNTANAQIVDLPLGPIDDFLNTVTNPAIAAILLTLGLNALLFELASPGGYVAGIIGAVCLLLAFYALGTLDANWVGLGFIILAFILFVLDVKAPTHGVLTAGGVISFIAGAAILFNTPYVEVPWATILALAGATAAFFIFAIAKALGAQRRQPATGIEGLVGRRAVVRRALDPYGQVFVWGELWEAETQNGPLSEGTEVEITGSAGMRLQVRKAPGR